jgi:hypothetical protein
MLEDRAPCRQVLYLTVLSGAAGVSERGTLHITAAAQADGERCRHQKAHQTNCEVLSESTAKKNAKVLRLCCKPARRRCGSSRATKEPVCGSTARELGSVAIPAARQLKERTSFRNARAAERLYCSRDCQEGPLEGRLHRRAFRQPFCRPNAVSPESPPVQQ